MAHSFVHLFRQISLFKMIDITVQFHSLQKLYALTSYVLAYSFKTHVPYILINNVSVCYGLYLQCCH